MRGHRATREGEIALIEDTAKKAKVDVGATVGLVTLDGLKRLRVAGIYRIGTTASLGGALVSSIPLADAQHWYSLDGRFTQVNAQAAPGVSKTTLRDRIRTVLGPRYKVQTGSEKAKADSKGIADLINGFLGPALLAFGGVAVLVGAFIIFNMFSITVAQRIREIAMLRTLGASRRQILTSVLLEALTTGLIGTVIGIFAGLLIAIGINALFDAAGFGLPTTSPQLATTGVVLGLVVGLGVTLVSALIPAVRATKIPPMAGLREGATLPRGRFARCSPILAGIFAARRRGADRQRRDRLRHCQPAPARHGPRSGADLLRRRHDRAFRRAAARAHRRRAAGRARERHARARERHAQPGAHRTHGRGADDRRRPRRLRGGVRRGPANVVHERTRQVAQERSDRDADRSERAAARSRRRSCPRSRAFPASGSHRR